MHLMSKGYTIQVHFDTTFRACDIAVVDAKNHRCGYDPVRAAKASGQKTWQPREKTIVFTRSTPSEPPSNATSSQPLRVYVLSTPHAIDGLSDLVNVSLLLLWDMSRSGQIGEATS